MTENEDNPHADREKRLEEAMKGAELAGMDVTPETLRDGLDYIDGLIDEDELAERVKERYGIRDVPAKYFPATPRDDEE
ncbi:hypothetical protein [Georgenia alba]|uniref:Antitoxin VbhA domain-containing protein n=1 Tax=Georgenia alba TaxID=2233858 RepID=A0ABW2Q8T4_9MICO